MEKILFYGSYLVFFFVILFFWQLRKKRYKTIAIFFLIISFVFIYARFIEPNIIITKNYNIDFIGNNKNNNLKIAVIADPHIGVYKNKKFLKRVVDKTNAINPDLILMPGDFVYHIDKNEIDSIFSVFQYLQAPTYAITGNHDIGKPGIDISEKIKNALKKYGVKIIDNEIKNLEINKNQIELIGLSDLWGGQTDFNLLNKINDKKLSIVLTHNPDSVYQFPNNNADLVIAGHTHGGQIRIPFIYKYAIPCDYDFDKGFYNIKGIKIFVSSGLGMVGLPLRFLIPPEISILNL